MKIAFLHYHLKTGGVTTVIRQQIQALEGACDTLALTGTLPGKDVSADMVHIPGLAYDSEGGNRSDPLETADAVWEAIRRKWPSGCDVLHVHNPTLAKNRNFLTILKALQKKGATLFLQIHDFSEDGRPGAYFPEPYPENCHYGVINSRDYRILSEAGLHSRGLHLLPNTVPSLPADRGPAVSGNQHLLYSVRAIRRKNIGEAILLAQLLEDQPPLCITLPPNSPGDYPAYESWKAFTARRKLPVVFDAGLKTPFADLVHSSRFMITTSITEGFGFSFLEPWTAGKYLWGRKLPDVCMDFEANGIHLDHLYARIDVPLDWMDETAFQREWTSSFTAACRHFQCIPGPRDALEGYTHISQHRQIDLGLLSEPFQEQVLSKILKSDGARSKLLHINPQLYLPKQASAYQTRISRNRAAVQRHYNPEVYRENLLAVYNRVSKTPVSQAIQKAVLAHAFLKPDAFSLLKWHRYPGETTIEKT